MDENKGEVEPVPAPPAQGEPVGKELREGGREGGMDGGVQLDGFC